MFYLTKIYYCLLIFIIKKALAVWAKAIGRY